MALPDETERKGGRGVPPQLILAALLVAALAAFVFQNSRRTRVHWLVFSTDLPLWLLLVVTSAIAVTAAELVSIALRHRGDDD